MIPENSNLSKSSETIFKTDVPLCEQFKNVQQYLKKTGIQLIYPNCILDKKICKMQLQNFIPSKPVKFLISWENDHILPENIQGNSWVGLKKLKSILDLVEKYEVDNFDGPITQNKTEIKIDNFDVPLTQNKNEIIELIDEEILPNQITDNLNEITSIVERKRKNRLLEQLLQADKGEVANVNFQGLQSRFNSTNNTFDSYIEVQKEYLHERTTRSNLNQEIVQGSLIDKDKIDKMLNCYKNYYFGKYQFLVSWAKRSNGVLPNPSWIDEDDFRKSNQGFLNKIIKQKGLKIKSKQSVETLE